MLTLIRLSDFKKSPSLKGLFLGENRLKVKLSKSKLLHKIEITNVFQNCAYDSPIADHLCFLGHATWSNTNRNEWPTNIPNTTLCPLTGVIIQALYSNSNVFTKINS